MGTLSFGSVRMLESGDGAPAPDDLLVTCAGGCSVPSAEVVESGGHVGHAVVGRERLVVEQVHQAAVVELDERMRVEVLEPASDLIERLHRRTVVEHAPDDVQGARGPA